MRFYGECYVNKLYKYISLILLSSISNFGFAALFYDVSDESMRSKASGPVKKYRLVGADMVNLKALLHRVPGKASRGVSPTIELPMPDGSMRTFTLERNETLSSDFANKHPDIITLDGYDPDNPEDLLKLDITPLGFHAMLITPTQGTIFIDPMSLKNTKYYKVYFKNDVEPTQGMVCKVSGKNQTTQLKMSYAPTAGKFASCFLRTYRLALAATAEYSAVFGGTKANAYAAMVTLMNRVNGVYQKDLGVMMKLLYVPAIIYTNPNTEPYSSGDAQTMLNENKITLNNTSILGASKYDIGHVVDTGAGGIAGLGVVCGANKAWGVTGIPNPVGDPFAIDYVAHEMGHQFGADHTFNNSCGGNREDAYAVEPGSGSTIMSYAGICPPNIQTHSNDYFHGKSLQQMGTYINSGGGSLCGTKLAIGPEPAVNDPANIVIPKSTPFMLNGYATGINSNNFTYTWEQIDPQISAQPPMANASVGPNFRSFKGTTSRTRFLPSLQALSTSGPYTWEVRPSVGRKMNFRVTVRQNNPGGLNCNNFQDMQVTVVGAAGPFTVTSFDTKGVIWKEGSQQTITWNVAGTKVAPINATTVDIFLSKDKGLSFGTVLANNVPNDGSQVITVPSDSATTGGRIMIRSHARTFFNVTHYNITIIKK